MLIRLSQAELLFTIMNFLDINLIIILVDSFPQRIFPLQLFLEENIRHTIAIEVNKRIRMWTRNNIVGVWIQAPSILIMGDQEVLRRNIHVVALPEGVLADGQPDLLILVNIHNIGSTKNCLGWM